MLQGKLQKFHSVQIVIFIPTNKDMTVSRTVPTIVTFEHSIEICRQHEHTTGRKLPKHIPMIVA